MKLNRVLITGGAGYVGSVLTPLLLNAGYEVIVLDLYLYGSDVLGEARLHPGLREIHGDIRDSALLKKELANVDAVIHLACISNDPSFELDPTLGKSINYDATLQLIDIAKASGVKRFVYASSSSVYGVKTDPQVTEDLPLTPLTDYSKYKAMCEPYLLERNSPDFTTLVLRPSTVCGYSPRLRLDLTVNILTIHALVNKKIIVHGGTQKRPNIHITDMATMYLKALEYPDASIAGKIYNVGYENYTVRDIAEMVKRTLKDASIVIETVPTNDLRSYQVSSEKIKRELSFTATHTVEEAISDLAAAYHEGKIPNPMTDPKYYNIKTMQDKELS